MLDDQESGLYPGIMFVAMVVYFLQQKEKPVLPVLHEVSANCVPCITCACVHTSVCFILCDSLTVSAVVAYVHAGIVTVSSAPSCMCVYNIDVAGSLHLWPKFRRLFYVWYVKMGSHLVRKLKTTYNTMSSNSTSGAIIL